MPHPLRQQILDRLWPAGMSARTNVFAIVDGARNARIYGAVDGTRLEKQCLFSGTLPWQLQMTAPYLVQLERENRLTAFLIDNGWGDSWGIFLRSETSFDLLRKHLRGFLRVRDEGGRRLLFRFYDPRVLRIYLPTCWPKELETLFGPVDCYLVEGEDGAAEMIEFRRNGDLLVAKPLLLETATSS